MKLLRFIFFAPLCCFAQQPELYFDKITVENGLSHNEVNCILQDSRGFIWIGTDDGLNRYDGKRFLHFRHRPHDSTSISGNIITDLLEDKEGRLWIATADAGLSRYDYRLPPAQQFKQYRHHPKKPSSIPVTTVNALLEDHQGFLWLGVSGKNVLRFNKKTEQFLDVTQLKKTVLDLAQDSKGLIWVGRQGGGLMKLDPQSMQYTEDKRYQNLYATLPHVTVTSIFKSPDGDMWFGSWDKYLYRYDVATNKEYSYGSAEGYQPDEVLSFAKDRQGRLWMGGREKGLQIYDSGKFYHYRSDLTREGSIAADRVNCLFMDNDGRMWLGTNRGISVNQPDRQGFVQQFLKKGTTTAFTVFDFYEDAEQNIWMGTSDGIFIRRPDGSIEQRPLAYKNKSLQVSCFYVEGNDWYIGSNYSLFKYDPACNAIQLLANTDKDGVMNKIINSRIVSVLKHEVSGKPVLMVVPYGHYLAYYDPEAQRWISRLDSINIISKMNLQDHLIRKLYRARNGSLWMATTNKGLASFSGNGLPVASYYEHNPDDASSIASNNVYDIAEDEKGNFWLSTMGGGLLYFDQAAKKFTQTTGSANLAEGLQLDHRGHVWMISSGHLQHYDPYRRLWSTHYLPDAEKTGGVQRRIFKDSKGHMYVAGNNYFISFQPELMSSSLTEPKAVLTDFQIFNQSYSHLLQEQVIRLRPRDNYFTIEFTAPDYISANNTRYQYKLDGFDKDWVDAGDRYYVSYSNLPGGNYNFMVRATNRSGAWSTRTASVQLKVIPPFWKTAPFFVLCLLVLGLAAYAIYRYRINELLRRQAIRNRIARDLHDNVGSTLSSISVYSQVAKIYQQKDRNNDLRNTLEKISDTSSEMISELNDTVWAINPQNDNMEVMLRRMESFARPLLATQNIRFCFKHDASLAALQLEMEKRKSFYAIFKEAVNNAVKYSSCRNISVEIQHKNREIKMNIVDDGKGFDLSKTSEGYKSSDVYGGGNGLRNMQQRATAMKGQLLMQSEVGTGTSICLRFPIP